MTLEPIAHMENDYTEKFGVPRQSGLVQEVSSRIVFRPEYRVREALRGLEGFSHLWVIWVFSQAHRQGWSPTVRPPRLGGNTRIGVFASRSPYRPNPIGLSCVRLERILWDDPEGPVLLVAGADLMNGTPILDIKPYLPYADCHPEALGGFGLKPGLGTVQVELPQDLPFPPEKRQALRAMLAQDPRPGYQDDPERVYGVAFAGYDIRFTVAQGVLRVISAAKIPLD